MFRCPGGQLDSGVETQLGENIAEVSVDGALGDIKLFGDPAVRPPTGHKNRDFLLTPGKPAPWFIG